jgi:hypothetical protein
MRMSDAVLFTILVGLAVFIAFVFWLGSAVDRGRMRNCATLFPNYTEEQCRFIVNRDWQDKGR